MAKQKPQTRFVVPFDGELKRLFSVREGSKGDLLITTHLRGLKSILKGRELVGIKECRDSIHASPRSEGNTVHGITVHEDGSQEHHYLSTTALRDHRFQPMHARTVIHPRSLETLIEPAKGEIVKLPIYNPEIATLHYAVWFCAPADLGSLPSEAPYGRIHKSYREFGLICALCYSPQPSTGSGTIARSTTTTAERRSAKHAELGLHTGPGQGAPAGAVPGYIVRSFNSLAAGLDTRSGYRPDDGPLVPQVVQGWQGHPIL